MSAITIDNDLVHYEVLGRGRPVILVHGWLGSWRYWIPTMQQLSLKYRIYALDLWGFGDSQKDAARYGFKSQVNLLTEFMDKLGIAKAALVGHSLGAAVAINFARTYPDRAPRIMVVSPPLFKGMGGFPEEVTTPAVVVAPSVSAAPPAAANVSAVSSAPITPPTVIIPPIMTPPVTTSPSVPTPVQTDKPAADPTSIPPKADDSTPAASDTHRRNPFLEHPERLAQLGLTPATLPVSASNNTPVATAPPVTTPIPAAIATPMPVAASPKTDSANPLLSILTTAKPRALLEKQLARGDENLEKLRTEVDKMGENVLTHSAQSFAGINLALELHQLTVPVLLLHGKDDLFLPAPDDSLLDQIAGHKAAGMFLPFVLADFHHFPMLESTVKFNRLLSDFLDTADLGNVQLKETWQRQFR